MRGSDGFASRTKPIFSPPECTFHLGFGLEVKLALGRAREKLHSKQPKLSVGQLRELCRKHAMGEYCIGDLAKLFSVSRPPVYRTLNRRNSP